MHNCVPSNLMHLPTLVPISLKRNTPPVTQRFTFHTRTTANFKLHTWQDDALYRPPKAQQQINIGQRKMPILMKMSQKPKASVCWIITLT
jgi:hypothetical protein